MIEIKNLRKSFGENQVLKDINITIQAGEIYGLVGISGAGKSTLLRCINGLEPYDDGSLKVDGIELKDLPKKELRKFRSGIGMIFQQFMLMERMTVYQNIAFPMKCWGCPKQEIDSRVDELLTLVELQDKRHSRPRELSGGQKQRVAIARALAMKPKILLCDEATSALDPNITKSILGLLRKINEELGLTIIIVTHQMSVVKQTCNRMSVLSHGELTCTGNVEEIFLEHPQALEDLLNEESETMLPASGINLEIFYRAGDSTSLLSRLALETGVLYELVWGKLDRYCNGVYGSFTIHIQKEDFEPVRNFLEKSGIAWRCA